MSNIPKPLTRLFVGREEDFARLDEVMSAGSGVISQTVHGLGGSVRPSWRCSTPIGIDRYVVRWWVTADSVAAIESGLAASRLGWIRTSS